MTILSTSWFLLSVSIDIREIQWGYSQHLLFYLLENCNNRFIQPYPSVQKSRPRIRNSLGTDSVLKAPFQQYYIKNREYLGKYGTRGTYGKLSRYRVLLHFNHFYPGPKLRSANHRATSKVSVWNLVLITKPISSSDVIDPGLDQNGVDQTTGLMMIEWFISMMTSLMDDPKWF